MKLDDVIPYIEEINDVELAKTILEIESDPYGYYELIHEKITSELKNHISEKELNETLINYEENKAIKHFQYLANIYDEIKVSKVHLLFNKLPFLQAIQDIKDIYSLRLYLTLLNKKLKDEDIDYKKYVPKYTIN